jgi:hypothetical protein
MHLPTVIVGSLALLFGLVSAVLRFTHPHVFKKKEPMQHKYGPAAGNSVHVAAYTLLPIIAGAVFIYSGLRGISIF